MSQSKSNSRITEVRDYSIVSIPKADLLSSSSTLANRTVFELPGADYRAQGAVTTIQPVLDVGPSDGSASLFEVNARTGMKKWELSGAGVQNPGQATLSAAADIAIEPFTGPSDAEQPGDAPALHSQGVFLDASGETKDRSRFLSHLVQQGDSVWGVHGVDANGRAGVRWYELDAETGVVRQSGTIADSALALIYPSIAVNPFGDAVIGFTATGEAKFPSAYAVVGDTVGGVTTFGPLLELKAGAATFQGLDSSGRNRWGDYSTTVLDPSNPYSFWTFQEFVEAKDRWAVQVSQIVVSGPVTRTEIVGATAMNAVRDTDSDAMFDNLGDTATTITSFASAAVGEVDPPTGSNRVERLVTKFPLPGEPGLGDRLETATLRFFLQQIVGTPAGPVSLLHSTSDNDLDRLASDFEDASYIDTQLDLFQPTGPAGAYYELDVTDQVLADYASDGANPLSAFRLQISELAFLEDNLGHYYSLIAGAGSTNRPRLTLTFIPVPEPPTALLAAMALLGLIGCVSRRAKPGCFCQASRLKESKPCFSNIR